MSKQIELRIPELGDFSDVEVIELLAEPGAEIALEDGLISLETDKAAMDIPADHAGELVEYRVAVGDTVNEGDVYAVVTAEASDAVETDAPAAETAEQIEPAISAAPAKTEPGASALQSLTIPDLGDFSDVEVIEVLIAPGDQIAIDDGVLTLETDKATMDIPSTQAGRVLTVTLATGDSVNSGDVFGEIEVEAATAQGLPATNTVEEAPAANNAAPTTPPPAAVKSAVVTTSIRAPVDEAGFSKAHASPSVRKLARELGVNLISVKGTGRKGRIRHDDVKAWVKQTLQGNNATAGSASLPAVPQIDFAQFGPIEEQKLSRIQKISGPRLHASWVNLPHVTQHDEADITELEERRQVLKGPSKERGLSLTPLAFIVRAVTKALADFPVLASSLNSTGDALVMKSYRHIGFAADTPNGLMVPVIRDADRLDVYEIAAELATLSAAARDGKLKANQMQGAVFTISSLGGIGGTAFTPIVNAPEVAILGVSRSSMQPVWDGSAFQPRLMLPFSLSYDHRVVDGAMGVRFTTHLATLLADPASLLEAAL